MTAARHAATRPVRPSRWAALVQWRNWRLLVKLAAVLLVPALFAVGLGVVQIHDDVTRANSYADMRRLATLRGELRTLLNTLQMERTMSVERLSTGDDAADGHSADDHAGLPRQQHSVDSARTAVTGTGERGTLLTGVAAHRYRDAVGLLDRLPALRSRVASGDIGAWAALDDYGAIITGVLDLDQALAGKFATPELTRSATALYDLEAVEEQIHVQHAILLQAPGRDRPMTPPLVEALREADVRLRDKLGGFRALATPAELNEYRRTVTGAAVSRRARVVSDVLAESLASNATTWLPVPVDRWNSDSEATGALVDKVSDGFLDTLRTSSADLHDRTSDSAGVASVVLFAVLLLALAVGLGIGRHLLRSLAVLRSTALDVAEHRLPAAVESMREGRTADAVVDVVPVHTTEEFGQLARAFDTVHSQAVRLAAEQAALRGDLRNSLVNLSRRSQSLVDRLLLMMEQLERHEEDPEQLASLFALDHLATRMRRNNENMMVLCGSALVRSSQGAALDAVLRSAVSEIEQYQRVLVQPGPSVEVVGYAAGDLGRLVAELLDNATAFSPPHTQVLVGGVRQPDGSLLIEILDDGIGMSESDLARANRRVATDAATDAPASRQLGLSVVGRLAGRHGIAVSLSPRPGVRGLRARVLVPARLVTAQAPARTDRPGTGAGRPAAPRPTLPTRTRGGRTDGAAPATLPPRKPFATATTTAFTPRPVPPDRDAPHKTAGPPWFALAASATAARGTGDSTDAPAPRAATEKPALAVRRPAGGGAREPDRPADSTQAGLPRRVPRTPPAPARTERAAPADGTAASRNASRAHSFLSSYQSGIRRAQPDQTHNPSATGRKNP
ncbi:nitrate- and nitrite sensing domain-containing protein [Streptomyces sp. ISL-12]|uniref:nitrate- and nitrite sensing domain-containing protein n=1 Tax=Streptomyces sp. ISL-12 TaxID=2819177 RepID=UPI001BE5BF9C|nr:nitrate- and nitrite sensing domain-containing protein [Streptomyces sp. ISL-12]MBT2413967.1 nitrate- and nitrite sensing domain-containing protein [Streptomyces sp. ISL-12]